MEGDLTPTCSGQLDGSWMDGQLDRWVEGWLEEYKNCDHCGKQGNDVYIKPNAFSKIWLMESNFEAGFS